jgi:large subunit ribosomal protein L24
MAETNVRIRKNDIVKIMTGKEKGKVGRVIRVVPEKGRIFVEKVNMVKRHTKPGKANPRGGIVEKEAPLSLSNVLVMCDKCSKPTRIGMAVDESGERNRVCRKCGTVLAKRKK